MGAIAKAQSTVSNVMHISMLIPASPELAGKRSTCMSLNLCRSPRFGSSRGGPPPGKKFGNPGERLRKKRWDLDELPKFEKNFYTEHVEVQRVSQVLLHITL